MNLDLADDFDGFYHANFGDTVAMTYAYTADLGAAQDIAQEAFCRAWIRWRAVSTYDNPVAWVRRVATNLARSRWRQMKLAGSYLIRQRVESDPGPNPDHVAVVAALRKLPPRQRQAVVLHHLMDLPVDEVAQELEVPAGTVKSWLHRARAAMARDLQLDVRNDVTTPPASTVVALARKRQRARNARAAVFIAVLLGGAAVLVQLFRPQQNPVIHPTPGPQPSPSVTPAPSQSLAPDLRTNMADVNWGTASVTITGSPAGCPSGTITFRSTEFEGASGPAGSAQPMSFLPSAVVFGDLTGDGHPEAVIPVSCGQLGSLEFLERSVLVVEGRRDGTLHSLGWTGRDGGQAQSAWIDRQVLYLDARPHPASGRGWGYELGTVQAFRWAGSAFESVASNVSYPPLLPTRDGTRLDLTPVADRLTSCDGLPPRSEVRPSFDAQGTWTDGDRIWAAAPQGKDEHGPLYLGNHLLLTVACGNPKTTTGPFTSTSIVLFERAPNGWNAVDVIAGEPRGNLRVVRVEGGIVEVSKGAKYRLDGSKFVPVTR